jgi:CubicO group peptidase (beta-lactamase class C family)
MNKKLFTLILVTIGSMYLYSHTNNNYGKWFATEQKALNQRRQQVAQTYWDAYVIQQPNHDHTLVKDILKSRSATPDNITELCDEAINTKNFTAFFSLFSTLDDFGISIIDHEKQLSVPFNYGNFYDCKSNPTVNPTDIDNLQQYIKDSNFSGIVSIHQPNATYTVSSPTITDHSTAFSIHSISKIFTEILTLIMIQEGIIQEEWLHQPLRISDTTKKLLPPTVMEQLSKTTTIDIMIHHGGFGDYTFDYFNTLATMAKNGETIIPIKKLEDFLQYADDSIVILDSGFNRYSNLGLLLLGLSIEHCYNTAMKLDTPLSFDEILHKYIIQPAGMKTFSSQKPHNACYNESGSCSQYICGSPAGSHWTTADDLHKFGIWLHKKYINDVRFKQLMEMYGSEFYNITTEEAHHSGGIGQQGIGEASARFALFLRHGISIVTLSNRPQQAFSIYKTIYHNILADQSQDQQ